MTACLGPQHCNLHLQLAHPRGKILRWTRCIRGDLDLVEDIAMSGLERISAHAGLSRNRRWTDPHDSALMIRVMSFTTDQAREGSSI